MDRLNRQRLRRGPFHRIAAELALAGFIATCFLTASLAAPLHTVEDTEPIVAQITGESSLAVDAPVETVEGDIIADDFLRNLIARGRYPPAQAASAKHEQTRSRRAALVSTEIFNRRWPGGIVPYQFDPSLKKAPDFKTSRSAIRRAIRHWMNKTCIQFVPKRKHHLDYIVFLPAKPHEPCRAHFGYNKGPQQVYVGYQCTECNGVCGKMVHELGHVVGFLHEQSRPDRDQYVKIFINNVKEYARQNFQSYSRGLLDSLGVPYDYDSIMHYSNDAFAKNPGLKTIEAKGDPNRVLGQRDGLSPLDIEQVNLMYRCPPPTPHPCTKQRNPVRSGNKLSIQINERKWLRCQNSTCRRASCHCLTDSRCDRVPCSCGGDMFHIRIRQRNDGDKLYPGDQVMFEAVGENNNLPAWLQCTHDPELGSQCSLSNCLANSADSWANCRAAVFTVEVNHTSAEQVSENILHEHDEVTPPPVHDNDKIALCKGSGKDRICISCPKGLHACIPIRCAQPGKCPDNIFFSLRQWKVLPGTA